MGEYVLVPIEVNLDERWVKLGESPGTVVQIWGSREPAYGRNAMGYFGVAIIGDGLRAETAVGIMERGRPPLPSFIRRLANDWRGETAVATWEAIEHDLTLEARRDSLGHVVLTFSLRESFRPEAWQARGVTQLDAGEEMSQLADALEILMPDGQAGFA